MNDPVEKIVKTVASSPCAPASAAIKPERINVNEPDSLSYWVATLDCDELQLRMAVAEVGPAAADVGNQLGRRL